MEKASLDEVRQWVDLAGEDVFEPYDIEILKFLVGKAEELEVERNDNTLEAVTVKIGETEMTWSLLDGFEFPDDALRTLWAAVRNHVR